MSCDVTAESSDNEVTVEVLTSCDDLDAGADCTDVYALVSSAETGDIIDTLFGGTTGQVLRKASNADLDTEWHTLVKADVGLGNVDNTSDVNKPVSTAQAAAIAVVQADVDAHEARVDNPHSVTKSQVGLGNVDNTSDINKPVSTAQATAIGVVQADVDAHEARTDNPHSVTKSQVGLGNADNTSDLNKPISTATQAALDLKEDEANKGVANGYAPLNASVQVPIQYLPNTFFNYLGTWDAATNTPTLADGVGTVKDAYIVTVGAVRDLGSGNQTFNIGDYVIYNGSIWQVVPSVAPVSSVNTKTGAVVLVPSDIGLGNVDNTSDINKPVSTAQAAADNAVRADAIAFALSL